LVVLWYQPHTPRQIRLTWSAACCPFMKGDLRDSFSFLFMSDLRRLHGLFCFSSYFLAYHLLPSNILDESMTSNFKCQRLVSVSLSFHQWITYWILQLVILQWDYRWYQERLLSITLSVVVISGVPAVLKFLKFQSCPEISTCPEILVCLWKCPEFCTCCYITLH